MMYRQRLFMETSPKLIQGFHSAEPGGLYIHARFNRTFMSLTISSPLVLVEGNFRLRSRGSLALLSLSICRLIFLEELMYDFSQRTMKCITAASSTTRVLIGQNTSRGTKLDGGYQSDDNSRPIFGRREKQRNNSCCKSNQSVTKSNKLVILQFGCCFVISTAR